MHFLIGHHQRNELSDKGQKASDRRSNKSWKVGVDQVTDGRDVAYSREACDVSLDLGAE